MGTWTIPNRSSPRSPPAPPAANARASSGSHPNGCHAGLIASPCSAAIPAGEHSRARSARLRASMRSRRRCARSTFSTIITTTVSRESSPAPTATPTSRCRSTKRLSRLLICLFRPGAVVRTRPLQAPSRMNTTTFRTRWSRAPGKRTLNVSYLFEQRSNFIAQCFVEQRIEHLLFFEVVLLHDHAKRFGDAEKLVGLARHCGGAELVE